MKTNILRIRFELFGSVLFAVIAYAVSVNMEIGFFTPNWWWMSNNFALTVSGGVFTGFLVALLNEAREYEEKKLEAEDEILYYSKEIYVLVGEVYCKIIKCLESSDAVILDDEFGSYDKDLKGLTEEIKKIKNHACWFKRNENMKNQEYLMNVWCGCCCLDLTFGLGLFQAKTRRIENDESVENITSREIE